MKTDLDRLRAQVDVQRLYLELFPHLAGKRRTEARCFRDSEHAMGDRHPSVQLHADGFHCHGCGTRGDALSLVQAALRCDFRQAVVFLQDRFGLATPTAAAARVAAWEWPTYSEGAQAMLDALWGIVRPLAPTPAAAAWLQGRGVEVETAWALGCRDWWPASVQIHDLLRDDTDAAAELNLWRDGRPWWVLRGRVPGLVVPAFHPHGLVPVAFRWRFTEPCIIDGRALKSAAQSGGQPMPLGVRVPVGVDLVQGAGNCQILVIAEGEPDWLSLHDALAGAAAVLGVCDVSGGWRSAWSDYLQAPALVIVATHAKANDPIGKAVAATMHTMHGRAEAARRYRRLPLPEKCDANDLHQAGQLLPLLRPILEAARG